MEPIMYNLSEFGDTKFYREQFILAPKNKKSIYKEADETTDEDL